MCSKCMNECNGEQSIVCMRSSADLCYSSRIIFSVSGEYDLSALYADISSMLIGKGILIYPCVLLFFRFFVFNMSLVVTNKRMSSLSGVTMR